MQRLNLTCRRFLAISSSGLLSSNAAVPSLIKRHPVVRSSPVGFNFLRRFGTYHISYSCTLPMKPGAPILGVDIYKDKDPVVALARSEYPDWVGDLSKPLPTLADLRRISEAEATDKDKMRYLKLTRRIQIKKKNNEMGAQKR
jgi:hypothetical protein